MSTLGSHGWGVCHTSQIIKADWGEQRKCGPTPWQQQPTVDLQHSLPYPKPKLTLLKAVQKKGWQEVTPVPFINPDPMAHFVGCSNEAPIIIDGQETMALIDSGDTGLQCEFTVLWRAGTGDPSPGSVIEVRGDRGHHHPLPRVCGGQPPDPQGFNNIMKMCCCWLYQPWPILKWSWSWLAPQS